MIKLKPKLSRCPTCRRKGMERRRIDIEIRGGVVPKVDVDVCPHCGEELYDPDAMRAIEAAVRCKPNRQRGPIKIKA